MRIGVLAQQGAFAEHLDMLEKLGVEHMQVRLPQELDDIDGLIIPGGETTSITNLNESYGMVEPVRAFSKDKPVFGTCAGLILMAREVVGGALEPLGIIDILVKRNAFGRQRDSFEAELDIPALGNKPYHGIFIRAPLIEAAGPGVEVMASLANGDIVAVRQGRHLAIAFHPELTMDTRVHELFLSAVSVGIARLRA